jgi:2-polyprenyl-6-methoxyphenol hydroxylase-like FAD-dependent oxidoreductase
MHAAHSEFHDVVIAGAGPVGLFLACELRLVGCSVLVLEQAQDPRSPLKELPFGCEDFRYRRSRASTAAIC